MCLCDFQATLILTVKVADCTAKCFSQELVWESACDLPSSRTSCFIRSVFSFRSPGVFSSLPLFFMYMLSNPRPPPTPHLLHPFHATLPFLILLFLLFIFFICLRPRPAHPPTHNYRNMNEPNTMNTRHVGWRDVMFQGQTYYIFLSDFWYVEAGDRLLGVCEWTRSKSGQKQVESVAGYILRCLSLICFLFSMGGKVNVSKRHTRVLYLLLSFSCRGDEEQVKVCLPENNWYVVFVWSYALEISHHNAVIESNKWCF